MGSLTQYHTAKTVYRYNNVISSLSDLKYTKPNNIMECKMTPILKASVLYILLSFSLCHAEAPPANNNKTLTLGNAAKELKWELGGLTAGILYLGLKEWRWGSNKTFKFNNEGFFGMDTGSGGADKLGHLYSTYVMDEFLTDRLYYKTGNLQDAAMKGAIFSAGLMLFVETFDGLSEDHGFSYEDVIMNTTGIGISYLKNTVPGLRNKLDLRVEYHRSQGDKGHPVTDYTGYNYSAVLKLGGFKSLRTTPLKYVELQLGYHAEGFKKDDRPYFKKKKTRLYAGIGLDLSEVLFKPLKKQTDNDLVDMADTFFRYYQAPGIYTTTSLQTRSQKL
ncbi:MAG: hypothetical protein DSZ29_05630 [Aquificaceae bacterium]|nr:MAG: hypothetical protein DSZ29_05630 [Aquificaceae bacterium]